MENQRLKRGRAARPTDDASIAEREALDRVARGITDQVTQKIIRARDEQGIGNEELRARLAAEGWTLTQYALSGLLAGSKKRRVFPLHEILIFARALEVLPHELMPNEVGEGKAAAERRALEEDRRIIEDALARITASD